MSEKKKPRGLKTVSLNPSMAQLLGPHPHRPWEVASPPPSSLLSELQRGLEWDAERVVYRGSRHSLPGETNTCYEFYGSKKYIGAFTKDDSLDRLVRMAVGFSIELSKELLKFSHSFKIYILGFPKESPSELNDACVQFHLDRPGELPWEEDQIQTVGFNPTLILGFAPKSINGSDERSGWFPEGNQRPDGG